MNEKSNIPPAGFNGHDEDSAPPVMIPPVNGAKSSLSQEFLNVLADIEYLIKDISQKTGDDLVKTTAKLGEKISVAKNVVDSIEDTLADQAYRTAIITNDYVKEQPWKAIGIGVAFGVALGAILARR